MDHKKKRTAEKRNTLVVKLPIMKPCFEEQPSRKGERKRKSSVERTRKHREKTRADPELLAVQKAKKKEQNQAYRAKIKSARSWSSAFNEFQKAKQNEWQRNRRNRNKTADPAQEKKRFEQIECTNSIDYEQNHFNQPVVNIDKSDTLPVSVTLPTMKLCCEEQSLQNREERKRKLSLARARKHREKTRADPELLAIEKVRKREQNKAYKAKLKTARASSLTFNELQKARQNEWQRSRRKRMAETQQGMQSGQFQQMECTNSKFGPSNFWGPCENTDEAPSSTSNIQAPFPTALYDGVQKVCEFPGFSQNWLCAMDDRARESSTGSSSTPMFTSLPVEPYGSCSVAKEESQSSTENTGVPKVCESQNWPGLSEDGIFTMVKEEVQSSDSVHSGSSMDEDHKELDFTIVNEEAIDLRVKLNSL